MYPKWGDDLVALYNKANLHINSLYVWFCANKLSLNASKTKYIVLRPKHKKCSFENLKLAINGLPLNRIGLNCDESSAKFLGIHIDEHLTWQHHVDHVNRKISRAMFAIRQVKRLFPIGILRNLYFALIQSHLSYGIIAWGNAGSTILRKTMTLQKRAIRTINKGAYNSHTDPLFHASNILKLDDLYQYQAALFMFDYTHNNLPNSFVGTFPYNREIQTYRDTRQSDLLFIPRGITNFASKLPLLNFPRIWNNWVNILSDTMSSAKFKGCLKSSFIFAYPTQVHCSNAYCKDCR